jgi:hypothetical protein
MLNFELLLFCYVTECEVYVSDYHRERCWERWMTFTDSDLQIVRSEVLVRLRRVALATALYQYNIVKDELTASQVWQRNSSLQKWFEATWLNKPSVCHAAFLLFQAWFRGTLNVHFYANSQCEMVRSYSLVKNS